MHIRVVDEEPEDRRDREARGDVEANRIPDDVMEKLRDWGKA
jgi:hypothetical protein